MVNPNWGLMQPVDIGGMFNQGVEQGRQRRIEQETDRALQAYAQNPQDANAVNALLRFNPRLGMQLREQQQQQVQRQQGQADTSAALGGDIQAFHRLATTDPEQWARIRPEVERINRTIGEVAMASNSPQEWDANVNRLIQTYGEGFRRYLGRYDLRQVAIAQTGQMREWLASQEPRMMAVAPGGSVIAMDRDGQNPGYLIAPREDGRGNPIPDGTFPGYTPPAQRQPQAPQAAPITDAEAAPILQNAAQTKVMSQADADRIIAALGPNGQARFQQWAQANGVTIGQPAPETLPPGFVMDN